MLTIDQIQQTVAAYFKDKPVKKVWLFGSYARGEATEDSDVDLLVRYNDAPKRVSFFDILKMGEELKALLQKEVQFAEEGRVYRPFWESIHKDLKPIYESV